MNLLLDEMLDQRLARSFASYGHECLSAEAAGFKGLSNGELLKEAELRGFDALLTVDQNIQYQTNLTGRKIRVLIICAFKNKLSYVLPYLPEVVSVLQSLKPGEVRYVGEPRLVRKHSQT